MSDSTAREHEWNDYYRRFSYFSRDLVRDGCHPRILEHGDNHPKSIVLVHGLTDSPYFMMAIAEHFFENLGYNVYLPLLHMHGLKNPNGMEGVELEEWKENVAFAVEAADSKSREVSIGGLSTGGTLSFAKGKNDTRINGAIYLFSAALDLAGGRTGLLGEVKEWLLRTRLANLLDKNTPLIGKNPYRYSGMDMDGAQELARLIKETDSSIGEHSAKNPFPKRVFAAHSESDTTANITGIEALQRVSKPDQFTFHRIDKKHGVSHASLVLRNPIRSTDGEELEAPNPRFDELMRDLTEFAA